NDRNGVPVRRPARTGPVIKEGDMEKRTRRQPDPEEKLDRGVRALVGKSAADYQPDDWRSLREQLRLQVLYPGRFVAFCDRYEGEGESRRLVERKVLGISRSLAGINKQIDRLPEKERQGVLIDFVEPSAAAGRGR